MPNVIGNEKNFLIFHKIVLELLESNKVNNNLSQVEILNELKMLFKKHYNVELDISNGIENISMTFISDRQEMMYCLRYL
jgi:hypothetical protein